MRRSKEAYTNYVCPYCWNALNRCLCSNFPPYYLVMIDKGIQSHIRILNRKGYHTVYCCEGHMAGNNTYITFKDDYFKDISTPEGFKYDRQRRTVTYTYSTKLSKAEVKALKAEKLAALLNWVENLPDRNNITEGLR